MADFIVVRLHPAKPIPPVPDPAIPGDDFMAYLQGLTVRAYDLSCADPTGTDPLERQLLGEATYVAPLSPDPTDLDPATRIVQHFTHPPGFPPPVPDFESVATAIIEVAGLPPGYLDYGTFDVRLEFERGGTVMPAKAVFYDVEVLTGVLPPPVTFPEFDDTTVALYATLPRPPSADEAGLDLADDGSPPSYAALHAAIVDVLAKDHQPDPPATLDNLTPEQARHIAYEIIWGPREPVPAPPSAGSDTYDAFGILYTRHANANDGTLSSPVEQNRQQFEGELNAFYALRNAQVDRLARYVYAVSAAVQCEARSTASPTALLQFPANPANDAPKTVLATAQVILRAPGGGALVPAFTVPAEYFYVLGAQLPLQLTPEQRFLQAVHDDPARQLALLTAAVDDGTIAPADNPARAVRRLGALAPQLGSVAPTCDLDGHVLPLVQAWLDYPHAADWRTYRTGDDTDKFWKPIAAVDAQKLPYLYLVLRALTDNTVPLVAKVIDPPVSAASVSDLAALTDEQWRTLFGAPPDVTLLPPFTAPGTPGERVEAFLRWLHKFFNALPAMGTGPAPVGEAPPLLDFPAPGADPIARFAQRYAALSGAAFTFGAGPLNDAFAATAAQQALPGDVPAQAWLNGRAHVINDLCLLAGFDAAPVPAIAFSVAEALYARGFTGPADIRLLSLDDFTDALRGTVAFAQAAALYAKAGAGGGGGGGGVPGPFKPVNPGSLVNCVPPCHLSPLGPVQYLHELLALSEAATCADPTAPPPDGRPTLGAALAGRRGPLGDLLASAANADTPIPLIDIVNENLEHLVANAPATGGVVHDTAQDALAGHALCAPATPPGADCHDPATLFDALPEHASPAVPGAEPGAYDRLASDFSVPTLPYAQPLDVNRSYLEFAGTCRFEVMRTFRKEVTEFVLDPALPAPTFQTHLWRFPVRIDIALEYLGIQPAEYDLLFTRDIADAPTPGHLVLYELYGFDDPAPDGYQWFEIVLLLPEFLERTGLSYCELVELQRCGCIPFGVLHLDDRIDGNGNGDGRQKFQLPDCEPCCLERYVLRFPGEGAATEALRRLAVYLRLWRKLQHVCGARYDFARLCDICEVLRLFDGGAINPDFIRQLAAFQMLRDRLELRLAAGGIVPPGAHGTARTHLLALWAGPADAHWDWALSHLLDRLQHFAARRHDCRARAPHFVKLLAANLDPLSRLAGFDPAAAADTWHARPTNTLRFVEVLAKIYASHFSVGEILYLFTADEHLDGDDPFPLQSVAEANDDPLDLPEYDREHDLWTLRGALLAVDVADDELEAWTWRRIVSALHQDFRYAVPAGATDHLLSLGQHFFPGVLEHAGIPVTVKERQYRVDLATPSADTWNIPPDGPFRYDDAADQLWTRIPLRDDAVAEKLSHLRDLDAAERGAVQDLYHLPRIDLAPFAFLFPSLAAAERHLVEEPDEQARWHWFRRQFALAHRRCDVIAQHLARHVCAASGADWAEARATAWEILKRLHADENLATGDWEDDAGAPPAPTWPLPGGGAFAALLGLAGTGLLGQFERADGTPVWRELRGPLAGFGRERNRHNMPVPTLIPDMDLVLPADAMRYVDLRNGFAIQDQRGRALGGAESFTVRWSGVLLVEEDGHYEFFAGAPTPEGEAPDRDKARRARWRMTLQRGQKRWVVLSHQWHDGHGRGHGHDGASVPLRRGAYDIDVEFVQPPPDFSGVDDIFAQHTGFQLKYAGPDTGARIETLPLRRLYLATKDTTLDEGLALPQECAARDALRLHYGSSLRDIRRTYQRAFKALLFARRLALSGHRIAAYRQSELGYMLDHPSLFAGTGYYRNPAAFARHAADFDFDFLPLLDGYRPPAAAADHRVAPSAQRRQALFDWFERLFDYTRMRHDRQRAVEHPVWLLFEEAGARQPDNQAQLLRHLGVDLRHADLALHYFVAMPQPVLALTYAELEDERWAIRAWHADQWARRLVAHVAPHDIRAAHPALWASDDPAALVAGAPATGNADLAAFVVAACLDDGAPPRYADLKRLNDGLRERARQALLAWLCAMHRVALPWGGHAADAKDLSALLLVDVEAGACEHMSRIEEAIAAVQNFVLRARLGLEGAAWTAGAAFFALWKQRFASYVEWERCACRALYRENWIEWDELEQARKIEAYRFLESELRRSTLTIAQPGGLEYWPQPPLPPHAPAETLQRRSASSMQFLVPQREGLALLGTPEHDARPSWLAPGGGTAHGDDGNPDLPGRLDNVPAAVARRDAAIAALPFWDEAPIRVGTTFVRVAAAGIPPAAAAFQPRAVPADGCCCTECGGTHAPQVDEYYFWLTDAKLFAAQPQDAYYDPSTQSSARWHDENELPALLAWDADDAVCLAWCRVHDGQFRQPRRSAEVLRLSTGIAPDLAFVGRSGDSLTFTVSGAAPRTGYDSGDPPGFRYDMAADAAVALPLVAAPAPVALLYPAGLPVYPFFAYAEPGARVFPHSLFSPAIAVAGLLRCHCRYESALKWYGLVLDPLAADNTWIDCDGGGNNGGDWSPNGPPVEVALPGRRHPLDLPPPMCCDTTDIDDDTARRRALLLPYVETLVEWSRADLRRDSPEAAQQARLLLDTAARILGPCPRDVVDHGSLPAQTVADFEPLPPPLNPRLLALYRDVRDGLASVHRCLGAARLRQGTGPCRTPWSGADPCACATPAAGCDDGCAPACCADDACHRPHSQYRFAVLLQKAQEAAARMRDLGNALVSAYERGDAEYLAALRARQESQLADLNVRLRQDQWRDADWQVKALGKTKEASQANRRYYQRLIDLGQNYGEIAYANNTGNAIGLQSAALPIEATGEALRLVPDLFVGFPCEETWLPLGSKLGEMFQTIARITNESANIASTTAGLDLTQAEWARRLDEWVHQVEVLDIEIEQIELQILAAERRRGAALQELNTQQRMLEQSREVLDVLRDKFSNHELYLFLQRETTAMYWKMAELAREQALAAQHAFNVELGQRARRFVDCGTWDDLHEGLMAGERLQLALQRMDAEYLACNRREYELTKHVSLAMHFPLQFLRLKLTGCAVVEIPEWMFDMDYPGFYMRRIRSISLTIPCVTGPYTGVHCQLTLLRSEVRVDPALPCPASTCCSDHRPAPCDCRHAPDEHYAADAHDARIVRHYGACEAIATSSGRSDAGLFELNFRDERHLPFEYAGAVSCWRIELPPANNYFDMDSLTDVILHMNYTAREGGDALREAARAAAAHRLPGNGWIHLDLRKDFPDAWELLRRRRDRHTHADRAITLEMERKLFPYLPGNPPLKITRLALLVETADRRDGHCPHITGCPCAQDDVAGSHLVEVTVDRPDIEREGEPEVEITCVRSGEWACLYHGAGAVDIPVHERGRPHRMTLTFEDLADDLERIFVLCRYETVDRCCPTLRCAPRPTPTC